MTLTRRVIACLDIDGGRVVKGVGFRDLRHVGDPVALSRRYEREGADEIVFLDVSASTEGRALALAAVRATASRLFLPLTVGGGIRSLADVGHALRAGADKVALNTAAVARPALINEASGWYGAQCVVASIDAARTGGTWRVHVRGGRQPAGADAVAWAVECAGRGAGEILLTSIDRDGTRAGYDLELLAAVVQAVDVPVIASGGAGHADHVVEAFRVGADAALVAGILHESVTSLRSLKARVAAQGLPTRLIA